jgi:DNA mismatch endonuclease (patch repair protein)
MDTVDKVTRSKIMSRIRGKNTAPEKLVRSIAHRLGYRFRLHRKDLPGSPDLVFPRHRKIILVHGCFWHGHKCKSLPKSNVEFWSDKIAANKARDRKVVRALRRAGWKVLVLWECRTRDAERIEKKIAEFMNAPPKNMNAPQKKVQRIFLDEAAHYRCRYRISK